MQRTEHTSNQLPRSPRFTGKSVWKACVMKCQDTTELWRALLKTPVGPTVFSSIWLQRCTGVKTVSFCRKKRGGSKIGGLWKMVNSTWNPQKEDKEKNPTIWGKRASVGPRRLLKVVEVRHASRLSNWVCKKRQQIVSSIRTTRAFKLRSMNRWSSHSCGSCPAAPAGAWRQHAVARSRNRSAQGLFSLHSMFISLESSALRKCRGAV